MANCKRLPGRVNPHPCVRTISVESSIFLDDQAMFVAQMGYISIIRLVSHEYPITGWCPPVMSWFINLMNTIVISAINHSYGSYKPT